MLIAFGKISTAFNLTVNEGKELLSRLPSKPVIPLSTLLIDPEDRQGHDSDPLKPFSFELAAEYAAKYSAKVFKSYNARHKTIKHIIKHCTKLHEIIEQENADAELTALEDKWLDPNNDGIISRYCGRVKNLSKELYDFLLNSYAFCSYIELEEAVLIMEALLYPLQKEVKGLTKERYQAVINDFSLLIEEIVDDPNQPGDLVLKVINKETIVSDGPPEAFSETRPEPQPEPNDEMHVTQSEPKTKLRKRNAILLKLIKDEADKHGLAKKHYIYTEKTIRNWLNGTTTPPQGFSSEVMGSLELMRNFAKKYIELVLASGSSELAANAKKEVTFSDQIHGVKIESPEDAFLLAEAFKDLGRSKPGGKEAEIKRKKRRNIMVPENWTAC